MSTLRYECRKAFAEMYKVDDNTDFDTGFVRILLDTLEYAVFENVQQLQFYRHMQNNDVGLFVFDAEYFARLRNCRGVSGYDTNDAQLHKDIPLIPAYDPTIRPRRRKSARARRQLDSPSDAHVDAAENDDLQEHLDDSQRDAMALCGKYSHLSIPTVDAPVEETDDYDDNFRNTDDDEDNGCYDNCTNEYDDDYDCNNDCEDNDYNDVVGMPSRHNEQSPQLSAHSSLLDGSASPSAEQKAALHMAEIETVQWEYTTEGALTAALLLMFAEEPRQHTEGAQIAFHQLALEGLKIFPHCWSAKRPEQSKRLLNLPMDLPSLPVQCHGKQPDELLKAIIDKRRAAALALVGEQHGRQLPCGSLVLDLMMRALQSLEYLRNRHPAAAEETLSVYRRLFDTPASAVHELLPYFTITHLHVLCATAQQKLAEQMAYVDNIWPEVTCHKKTKHRRASFADDANASLVKIECSPSQGSLLKKRAIPEEFVKLQPGFLREQDEAVPRRGSNKHLRISLQQKSISQTSK